VLIGSVAAPPPPPACVAQMTMPEYASCGANGTSTTILGDYTCNVGYYKTDAAPYCLRMPLARLRCSPFALMRVSCLVLCPLLQHASRAWFRPASARVTEPLAPTRTCRRATTRATQGTSRWPVRSSAKVGRAGTSLAGWAERWTNHFFKLVWLGKMYLLLVLGPSVRGGHKRPSFGDV
jgi:hypothetical protein